MLEPSDLSLYVHWPFCQSKCPYCDFNSHVALEIDQKRWRDAYLAEISRSASETPGRVLNTIFFGGGTPSLMMPETVAAIIESAVATWLPSNDMEVTLEANPTSVESGQFRLFADAGVNRVSVGIQSLRDGALRRLGRLHSANEALDAFDLARRAFSRVSFDLIYARQGQSIADWRQELSEGLALAADHISLYQLTIEPGTAFGARYARGGLAGLPSEDLGADMFALTQDMTAHAGLCAYEISSHAAPGAESRHNLNYWRSGDWVGIGPGAHGRLTVGGGREAIENCLGPAHWLQRVEEQSSGESARTRLSANEVAEEAVIMGLRLVDGVSREALRNMNKINKLASEGLLKVDKATVRTTTKGRPLLNAILRELLL